MRILQTLIAVAACTMPALASEPGDATRATTMPPELVGVWSDNDAQGHGQCAAYRKNPVPDEGHDPLAGSVLISPAMIEARAKSGPDEYYQPDWVSQTAPATWLVRSNYYSGAFPREGERRESQAYMADTMTLKSGTLLWTGPETATRKLFRCSDLVE